MKVKELIEALQEVDPEMEVILQKDSEGNGYSPLAGADLDAVYVADTTWSGTAYHADWTAGDCCLDEEEWKELQAGPRALILYPVN
jgi:hypothetical protein